MDHLEDHSELCSQVKKGKVNKDFPCKDCGKKFSRNSSLARHERIHLNVKPFRCGWEGCQYRATQMSHLYPHINTVHFKLPRTKKERDLLDIQDDRKANQYIRVDTTLLAYRLSSQPNVKADSSESLHSKEHSYALDPARESTATLKADQQQQISTESEKDANEQKTSSSDGGKKHFICNFEGCGKSFPSNRLQLITHERIHWGVKPYRCSLCHQEFTQRAHVYCHVRGHHFRLPLYQKEQQRRHIEDDRNPNYFIEVNHELAAQRLPCNADQ